MGQLTEPTGGLATLLASGAANHGDFCSYASWKAAWKRRWRSGGPARPRKQGRAGVGNDIADLRVGEVTWSLRRPPRPTPRPIDVYMCEMLNARALVSPARRGALVVRVCV